jgi:hypothetical protein
MPEDRAAAGAGGQQLRLARCDPVAQPLVAAIHAGELESLTELLHEQPGLAAARLVDDNSSPICSGGLATVASAGWPSTFLPWAPS